VITVSVKTDMERLMRDVKAEARQVRISAAIALTKTAKLAQADIKQEMRRVFDRPVAYTLNSTFVKPATVQSLASTVGIKDDMFSGGKGTLPVNYLSPQIAGGDRKLKRFERALQSRGHLPDGMMAVPGAAAKIDGNGNMSRGQLMQILSALGAGEKSAGYSANRTARSRKRNRKQAQFFVGRPGGGRLPLGVWQSFRFAAGSAIKPVLIFVKRPIYRRRLDFQMIVNRTADREFGRLFQEQMLKRGELR